jgi:hypothetical protein
MGTVTVMVAEARVKAAPREEKRLLLALGLSTH